MFFRLLLESFRRQRRRKLLAGAAVLLGITAVTAMLALATTIGDQIHRELAVYGANIVITPESDLLDVNIGGVDLKPSSAGSYLHEADLPKLKGIFWRNNITGISPELPVQVNLQGTPITAMGLWFRHTLTFGTDSSTTGAPQLHPWWKLNGAWPAEGASQAVAGSALAARLNLHTGDTFQLGNTVKLGNMVQLGNTVKFGNTIQLGNIVQPGGQPVQITGIVSAGDETDTQLLIPLALAQQLANAPGAVRRVYVSAITKPEDAFARRDPDSLPPKQRDIWYCRPYANSIAYQIREAIPGAHAEQIRRVEQSEGQVLSRISGLMWLVSLAALIAASFAVSASMATAILERRQEIGLMRSLGASQGRIALLFYSETGLLALIGGTFGFLLGSGLAALLGQRIFGSPLNINFVLLPIMLLLALLVSIAGSTPSIRSALRLDPSSILRADA